jgi:methanogenic corrinoid protein MtbC1
MSSNAYRDPIYNLKAVVERTGVSADALRAWERRYGLPEPARTEARHRVYSQRDIDTIRWLVARQDEGLRIGRAVKLWRSIQGEGQDPLRTMPLPSKVTIERRAIGDTVAELHKAWSSSCLAFDEQAAEQALTEAFAMYPPEVVCSQIIGDGIAQIGQRWHEGEVTPQQEHFASQLAVRRLETLIAATPPPTRRGRILAACPPGEEHTLGLLTLTLLLRRAGWDVTHLGANVPLQQMEETIKATEPDLIVLAAQQLHTAANLLGMARLAQREELPLAFGGRIFNQEPELRTRIPGHFVGATLDDAVREIERLMTTAHSTSRVEPPLETKEDESHEEARAHFLDRQMELETDVWQAMRAQVVDREILQGLNQTMERAVDAALRLGDMDLVSQELDWLQELDACHRPPNEVLDRYLQAYYDAADRHLDERGALIVAWLGDRLGQGPGAEAPSDEASGDTA